jgi:hypothetical protein
MGILDRLFGSDDPLEEELENRVEVGDEEGETEVRSMYDSDSDEWPPHNVLFGKRKWPYEMDPKTSEMLAGREIYTYDDAGNPWMGKDIRDMIENRRYEPEAPTRIGYTKDNVKGVQDIYIDHNALFRHLALFGQTGYGKSTLMRNIMLQWINAGYGICYIDPKGDDSYELLQQIPPHRIDDVVWVEPANTSRAKQVGFNVFDTAAEPGDPRYENEVNSVAGDFVQILKDKSDNWGPQIGNITETMVTQLIRAEDPFNPIDLVKIITDEEEKEAFAQNYGDELEQIFMQRIAEQNIENFDPILRRIRAWVKDRTTRQIMAHEQSQINISEAVQDGKLLIINTSSIENGTTEEIVTRMIISRVWSTIRTRETDTGEDPTPYFLCIDEFDKVISDSFDINDIVSQARSFRLSVFVANQQPSQLPDDVKQAMQQVQSLLSFHPGQNPRDQQEIAQVLGDVDSWKLGDLERYQVVGRPYMNKSQQSAMIIHTYGEYPPLRDEDKAEKIVQRSLDKYGTEPNIETDLDKYGAKRFLENKSKGYEINRTGDTVTEQQVLECVYAASLRNDNREIDDKDDWVTLSQVKEEVDKYASGISEAHDSKLSNILEGFTSRELEKTVGGGDAYFRLGNEGLKKAFEPDTGSAASGGKSPHRILLREGHKAFTKLGYNVTLPSQDQAGSLPDGVAQPPIDPMQESDSFDEAVEKERELVKKYPRLAQLFGDGDISLEAESTTITRPAQTIKNLIKAIQDNKHCVFLVKDGSAKRDEFEYWARLGEEILTDPPFVRSIDEHGNRTFYTTNSKIKLSNKGTALVDKDVGQASWVEFGKENSDPETTNSIKLTASNSDEPLATFEYSGELWSKPSPSEFPYHYIRDTQSKETIVKDLNGDVVETYENLGELQRDGKFKTVHMPIIPEQEFPGGEIPDSEHWTFVIIPESNEKGPQIYDKGNIEPLLPEDGAKIDPTDFDDLKVDIDVEKEIPEEQLQDEFEEIVGSTTDMKDIEENVESGSSIEDDELVERQTSAVDPFDSLNDGEEEGEDEDEDEDEGTDPTSVPEDHKFPESPDS